MLWGDKRWRRFDETSVKGLRLPDLFLDLLRAGKWRNPGDHIVSEVIPFLRDPVDFLTSIEKIAFESQGDLADDAIYAFFQEYRGSDGSIRPLPWLDVDRAVFIAVNRNIGDDVGIALDYRSSADDPRVVASDWVTVGTGARCDWRQVSPTFTDFVRLIRLTLPNT